MTTSTNHSARGKQPSADSVDRIDCRLYEPPRHAGYESVRSFSPEDIRKRNRRSALRLLYPRRLLSRADIAKLSGISKSSASDIVSALLEDGLIREECVKQKHGPGKPAVAFQLAADARQIIIVDLSNEHKLVGALTNLVGDIQQRLELHVEQITTDDVLALVGRLRDTADAPLLGIGLSSPGIVDGQGTVHAAPNLGWHNVPLGDMVEDLYGIPTRVDNNANVAALGEWQFVDLTSNLAYIRLARGVGAGTIVNGCIVEGSRFAAGEIGHVVVDEQGTMCRCGKRGCLETLTSVERLRARIEADPSQRERIITQAGASLGRVLSLMIAMTTSTTSSSTGTTKSSTICSCKARSSRSTNTSTRSCSAGSRYAIRGWATGRRSSGNAWPPSGTTCDDRRTTTGDPGTAGTSAICKANLSVLDI